LKIWVLNVVLHSFEHSMFCVCMCVYVCLLLYDVTVTVAVCVECSWLWSQCTAGQNCWPT